MKCYILDACAIIVITSDHHEFDILETKRLFNFEWYR